MAKDDQPAAAAPQLVAIGSVEFNAAVAAAVQAVLAAQPAPGQPKEIVVQAPAVVQQTSIDQTPPGLDDLTVQFTRFCQFQNAGYQRGQQAGFPRPAAEALARSGSAFIVHDPRGRLGPAGAPLVGRAA